MDRVARDDVPASRATAAGPDDTAALRNAESILERVCADQAAACDEEAASEARSRLRSEPMPGLEPDATMERLLRTGERLLALRRGATLDRRQADPATAAGLPGDLYVTSSRLVFRGRLTMTLDLEEIDEVALSGDRLLLVTRDGTGIAIDTDRPRLLRVEIAAARAALRA